jgi:ABC-2 type transport system ATP-binding protein
VEQPVISLKGLTKIYGKKTGIDGISLDVQKGEIFGFLGPNGAGKTTTINLMLDIIRPTRGEALLFGLSSRKHGKSLRRRIGFIPGEFGLYENMKGMEYLDFLAGLGGHSCRDRILDLAGRFSCVNLNDRIKTYSKGMKQILGIIQAFMTSPDLYILDEPTASLDPLMCQQFYNLATGEKKAGKTIFLSSHLLGEVERLCGRVCIVKAGRVAALEDIESIRARMKRYIEVSFNEDVDPESLMVEGVSAVSGEDGLFRLEIDGSLQSVFARLSQLPISRFEYRKMSLEEIFWTHFDNMKAGPGQPGSSPS